MATRSPATWRAGSVLLQLCISIYATSPTLLAPANALSTLLTVESLLFAGMAAAASLGATGSYAVSPRAAAAKLALAVTCVLTTIAIGACFAWARVFLVAWPSRIDEQVPAICLLIGIAAQPLVAWTIVRLAYRR